MADRRFGASPGGWTGWRAFTGWPIAWPVSWPVSAALVNPSLTVRAVLVGVGGKELPIPLRRPVAVKNYHYKTTN
jgi:hypothetical protein